MVSSIVSTYYETTQKLDAQAKNMNRFAFVINISYRFIEKGGLIIIICVAVSEKNCNYHVMCR